MLELAAEIGSVNAVAAGAWTDIISITAPSEASPGETVNVQVKVKNLFTTYIYIATTGKYDNSIFYLSPESISVGAGATYTFSGSFTMPGKSVRVYIWSWYWTGTEWYQDDYSYKDIDVIVTWQKLATKAITITPEAVEAWEKLATKAVTITPEVVEAWEKLATKSYTLTPIVMGWQELASKAVTILPIAPGWERLATKSYTLAPKEFTIPPDFEKVLDKVYPEGETFNGEAERAIAEFKLTPEQIPGTRWWAETVMADKMASEVEKEGAKMLTLKVYENTTPTLWTEYILIAEATKPAVPARAVASPIAWAPIIYASLGIVGIIAFYFFFLRPVIDFVYKSPGAAIGTGLIFLGIAALGVLGLAVYKGTSVKEAITGKQGGENL